MDEKEIRSSRFTHDQIVSIINEIPDAGSIKTLAEKYGVSTSTISRWRKQYESMEVEEKASETTESQGSAGTVELKIVASTAAVITTVGLLRRLFKWKASRRCRPNEVQDEIRRAA